MICFRKGMRGGPWPVPKRDHSDRDEYLEKLGLTPPPENAVMSLRYFTKAIGIKREGKLRLQFVGDPMHWQMYKNLKEILIRYEYLAVCTDEIVSDRAKCFILRELLEEIARLYQRKKFTYSRKDVWGASSFREKKDQVHVLEILEDQVLEELERIRDAVFRHELPPLMLRVVKDLEGERIGYSELRKRYEDALGDELLDFAKIMASYNAVNSVLPEHLKVKMKTSEKLEWISTGINITRGSLLLVGWIGKFAKLSTSIPYITCVTSVMGVGFDVFHAKKDSKHLKNLEKVIEIMTGPDLSIAHGDVERRNKLLQEMLDDLAIASEAHEVTIEYPEDPNEKIYNAFGIEVAKITKTHTPDKSMTMEEWYKKYDQYGGKVDWSEVQNLKFHTASIKRGKNLRIAKIVAGSIGVAAAVAAVIFTGGAAAIVIAGVGVAAGIATTGASAKNIYDWTTEWDRRWLTAGALLEAAKADVLKALRGAPLADAVKHNKMIRVQSTARDQLMELGVIKEDEQLLFTFFSDGFMAMQYKLAQKIAAS